MKKVKVKLKDGTTVIGDEFDMEDYKKFQQIFRKWMNINIDLKQYSRGMGALGLPGDLSSASRFARVAFTKLNSKSGDNENDSVSQFFHILGSVDQQRGCCEVAEGKYEITIYTSCCNADKGIYYYTTYNCHRINAVDMHKVNLDDSKLFVYDVIENEPIFFQN